MSNLFRTSLKKIFAELDQSPPLEEWDGGGVAVMSLAVQIGILERLELMVELQAMLLSSQPAGHLLGPTVKRLAQVKEHYGWADSAGA